MMCQVPSPTEIANNPADKLRADRRAGVVESTECHDKKVQNINNQIWNETRRWTITCAVHLLSTLPNVLPNGTERTGMERTQRSKTVFVIFSNILLPPKKIIKIYRLRRDMMAVGLALTCLTLRLNINLVAGRKQKGENKGKRKATGGGHQGNNTTSYQMNINIACVFADVSNKYWFRIKA